MSIISFIEPDATETDQSFNFNVALNGIPAPQSDREPVKILLMGSRQGVNRIVYQLHQLRFAEFNEWSRLLPAPVPGQVMRILVRYISRAMD